MLDTYVPPYAEPVAGFQSRKAAQLSAFFAKNEFDGMLDKLKLIKLIYLTERRFLADYHSPMLYDELYSLPHGPICSSALNGIDGVIDQPLWSEFVCRNGNKVVACKRFARDELDELSDVEIDVAQAVWEQFGHMTASHIRNWTHINCPEYTETPKARIPITYRAIMDAVGHRDGEQVEREVADMRRVEALLSR